jgi:adenine-specific DNA-methyltransferase
MAMSPIERLSDDENFSKSSNLVNENIEALKGLFPEAVGEDGIDFGTLMETLGQEVLDGEENFGLNWPGKREARRIGLSGSNGTLRPEIEESKDWATTKNMFLEGDNLEVLKLLQKSYASSIKLIYIDPPYNTGNDFVYQDNFADGIKTYLELSDQIAAGEKLQANTSASGRKHSNWLSMMYPRLHLAKNLLSEDGVLAVSIDENEIAPLRLLLEELFGPANFIAQITRETIRGGSRANLIREVHDYVLLFARDISTLGAYARGAQLIKWGAGSRREDRPTMWYPITSPDGQEVWPLRSDGSEGRWRYSRANLEKLIAEGDVEFLLRSGGTLMAYGKIRDENKGDLQFSTIFSERYVNSRGAARLKELFHSNQALFDYAKPVELIGDLIHMANVQSGQTVLDFFAGSGTTGDAVMQANAFDGLQRNYILVQLPEPPSEGSELAAQGFGNIADATRERLRRAGSQISAEAALASETVDFGFRSFNLDASNVRPWQASAEDLDNQLDLNVDNIVEGRSELDVLFELILKLGLDLTSSIESFDVSGKTLQSVGEGSMYACLSTSITRQNGIELAQKIIELHEASGIEGEVTVIFRDSGFVDDSAKLNMAEMLDQAGFPALRTI